jgi:hypothetical protein
MRVRWWLVGVGVALHIGLKWSETNNPKVLFYSIDMEGESHLNDNCYSARHSQSDAVLFGTEGKFHFFVNDKEE